MCFWYPVVAKLNSFGFSCVVVGQWYSFSFILVSHFYFEMFGIIRSSPSEVFLGKRVLKICTKFTGEHPCRSVISIKLQNNFIEITLRHECSSVNLLHIFRISFLKNTSGRLLLNILRLNFCYLKTIRFVHPLFCILLVAIEKKTTR